VNDTCTIVQQALVESGGDPSLLSETERRHVAVCRECAAKAAAERRLTELLAAAVPAADTSLQQRILAHASIGRGQRVLALVPAAAGALLMAGGAVALGGLPGAGVLALTPGLSLGAGLSVAGGVGGVLTAAGTALQAIHAVVPGTTALTAGGAAALGAGLLALGVRRLARRLV